MAYHLVILKNKFFAIVFLIAFSQEYIVAQIFKGQLVELVKSKDAIKIPLFANASLLIESKSEKVKSNNAKSIVIYEVVISKLGEFEVDLDRINGDPISLYLKSENYAPIALRDIPKEKLEKFLRLIPVTRIVKKTIGTFDSFTEEVDEKKLLKRKNSL